MPALTPLQRIAISYDGSNLASITGEPAALAPQEKAALDQEVLGIRQAAARAAGGQVVSSLTDPLDVKTAGLIKYGSTKGLVSARDFPRGHAWIASVIAPAPAPRPVAAAVAVPRPAASVPAPARAALAVPVVPPPAPAPPSPVLSGLERAAAAINRQFSGKFPRK